MRLGTARVPASLIACSFILTECMIDVQQKAPSQLCSYSACTPWKTLTLIKDPSFQSPKPLHVPTVKGFGIRGLLTCKIWTEEVQLGLRHPERRRFVTEALQLRGGGRKIKLKEQGLLQDKKLKKMKEGKGHKVRYKAGSKDYLKFSGPHLYAIGGKAKSSDLSLVHKYDLTTEQWTPVWNLPTPRAQFGAERLYGRIFVVAGVDRFHLHSKIYSLCPYSDKPAWLDESSMPFPRRLSATASLNDTIFVFGGAGPIDFDNNTHNDTSYSSVQSYHPGTKKWENHTDMPVAKRSMAAISLKNRIYVLGGWRQAFHNETYDQTLATVDSYDLESRRWSTESPMSSPRRNFKAVSLGGKLYAIAGMEGGGQLDTVECFDPTIGQWTPAGTLKQKRSSFGAAVFNGKIYVAGGVDGKSQIQSMEEFDPVRGTWEMSTRLPARRSGFCLLPA